MPSTRTSDQDAARSVVRHVVWYRPQQKAPRAGHPLVADQDEVGVVLLRRGDQGLARVVAHDVSLGLDAVLDGFGGALELTLRVTSRATARTMCTEAPTAEASSEASSIAFSAVFDPSVPPRSS